MTRRSEPAEFIRSLVQGDYDATDRYERKLDEQGWLGFPRFLSAVFFLAVHLRFTIDDQCEIIQFVAELRTEAAADAEVVDPQQAETIIRRVLDPTVKVDTDQKGIGTVQTLVAHKILADEELSPEQLDEFLGAAEQLADRKS